MIVTNNVTIRDDPIWISRACPVDTQCMKWISVDERLPEMPQPAGQVEQYLGVLTGHKRHFVTMLLYTSAGYWLRDVSGSGDCQPTHWMPLPEPPKKGTNG